MSENHPVTVQLKERQRAYLRRMAETHNLPDESKALRVLLDFAIKEEDLEDRIFTEMRCLDC